MRDRSRAPTTGALASEDYAGNIGNQILERFRCTFDYERRDALPGARRALPGAATASRAPGVQLARYGDVVHGDAGAARLARRRRPGSTRATRWCAIDGKPVASRYTPERAAAICSSQARSAARSSSRPCASGKKQHADDDARRHPASEHVTPRAADAPVWNDVPLLERLAEVEQRRLVERRAHDLEAERHVRLAEPARQRDRGQAAARCRCAPTGSV